VLDCPVEPGSDTNAVSTHPATDYQNVGIGSYWGEKSRLRRAAIAQFLVCVSQFILGNRKAMQLHSRSAGLPERRRI